MPHRMSFVPALKPHVVGIATALAVLLSAFPAWAEKAVRFSLDNSQSTVTARVPFFGIASKSASFPEVSGGVQLDSDRPQSIVLNVTMNARALQAGDSVTLGRLKGTNFFDVERHPTIRFSGTSMRITGPRSADVDGELTARGVSRREVLKVVFDREPKAISGKEPVTIHGTMSIDRRNYGMTAYSLIVGNRVTIAIKVRMAPA